MDYEKAECGQLGALFVYSPEMYLYLRKDNKPGIQNSIHENQIKRQTPNNQISFSLLILPTSPLRTSLSTSSSLPSHSAQHSPLPTSPTSYHLCNAFAVLTLNSEIIFTCSSCPFDTRSICGCSWINAADVEASGMGRSLRDVSREAVSGKAEA